MSNLGFLHNTNTRVRRYGWSEYVVSSSWKRWESKIESVIYTTLNRIQTQHSLSTWNNLTSIDQGGQHNKQEINHSVTFHSIPSQNSKPFHVKFHLLPVGGPSGTFSVSGGAGKGFDRSPDPSCSCHGAACSFLCGMAVRWWVLSVSSSARDSEASPAGREVLPLHPSVSREKGKESFKSLWLSEPRKV